MGALRVTLIDGNGIRGVDRGGKSDPYAVFSLNGQKVFKFQTKKKTLTPSWNEDFMVNVPLRVGADFSVEVYDWNQIEQAKLLGEGKINLEDIEPFNGTERIITPSHTKHAEPGTIRISMLFQSEIHARSRKNTSTFLTAGRAGRAMTQVGAAPLKLGKGAFHGVTGVFKRGGHDSSAPQAPPPPLSTRARSWSSARNVMNAKNLPAKDTPKPYVLVHVGDRESKTQHADKTAAPEWNGMREFLSSASTPKLYA
ncbi:C2-domain-containing protein [Peniophora sp. CONT]|nr:C2-domain-containing protein [Peniophora sp. CONT]